MNVPVPFSPDVEHVDADENKTIQALTETLLEISQKTYADGDHALRSVHAKSHGLIEGQFEVLGSLPPTLAQGIFAKPGRYSTIMRLSTIAGDVLDDSVSIPRGLAVKVMDVPGARLPGSEGEATQDFLMADGPAFSAPTAKKFLGSLNLLAKTTDRGQPLKKALSAVLRGVESAVEALGGESGLLKTLGGHPNDHILGATFYAQAPIRYGDYVAKMSLAPASPELTALTGQLVDVSGKPDALRQAVRDHFSKHGGVWDLRAQLCTNLKTMPIEDASVAWPEDESPYITVATLTAPPQDAWSEDKVQRVDDSMSFSPWHGIAAHQPLGSVMRARRQTYEDSVRFRRQHSGCPIRA